MWLWPSSDDTCAISQVEDFKENLPENVSYTFELSNRKCLTGFCPFLLFLSPKLCTHSVLCVYIDNNVVIATFNAYITIQNENKYPEKDQIKITKLHTEYKINERERKAHTRNLWREKKRKKDERNDLWSTFQK